MHEARIGKSLYRPWQNWTRLSNALETNSKVMGKIVIIGVGNAGRTVLKKLKDEGLQDVEMMSFGNFPDDDREDIPHHNLITMNGHCGLGAFSDPQASKSLAEGAADQIEDIIDRAFMDDEQK